MIGNILIVDDDVVLRRSVAFILEQSGYRSETTDRAEDIPSMLVSFQPDLILLDIVLPGMDGLEALKKLREVSALPVILLTARRSDEDVVEGLNLGADDYIAKPFDTGVLLSRIKAVLRRSYAAEKEEEASDNLIHCGTLELDKVQRIVRRNGRDIGLSPREFDLLAVLVMDANHILPTNVLLKRVWGAEFQGDHQVLYVHIRWLRSKLEDDPNHPKMIITVRSVGYKFVPETRSGG